MKWKRFYHMTVQRIDYRCARHLSRFSSFSYILPLSGQSRWGACAYDCVSLRHEQHVRDRTCVQSPSYS